MAKKKSVLNSHNRNFLIMLVVFCGISLFAVLSFFWSTNELLDSIYVSVLNSDDLTVEEVESGSEVFDPASLVDIFSDMDGTHFNAEAIGTLYAEGFIKGYSDGTFRPDDTINRVELLTVITNALDSDFTVGTYNNCFSDVKDEWFAVFVCYAKEQGWVSGFDDGTYRPDQSVTKAGVLRIIFSAFDYEACEVVEEKPYDDVFIDAWYAPYACAAKRDGIIFGSGLFDASHSVTRAEFVQIVYNVMVEKGLLNK